MAMLAECKTGDCLKVLEFCGCSNFIAKMYNLGVKEGVVIKVKRKAKVCPILLEVNGSCIAVGRGMASKIKVEPCKGGDGR